VIFRKNEKLEYLMVILSGKMNIYCNNNVVGQLSSGNMLGIINYLQLNKENLILYDLIAEEDG
jgi:CRP-like cAMP-binding protein